MGVHEDLTGKKYGHLTVLRRAENKNNRVYWRCKCDCGNEVDVISTNLKSGQKTHCGCLRKGNIEGQKFGKLTAICIVGKDKYKVNIWKCKCDCGNYKNVSYANLKAGKTKSCGCLMNKGRYIHGLYGNRIRNIYMKMKNRCYCKTSKSFPNYGGRGIDICDDWLGKNGLENFYKWSVENGYNENLSIDRIDNNKGYSPNNCRWTDIKTQQNNRRNNIIIEYKNKKQTLKQWCDELGSNYKTALRRFNKGFSTEEILQVK